MLKSLSCLLVVFISFLGLSGNSTAGEQEAFSFTHKLRHIHKSDLKNGPGEFSLSRAEISANNTYMLFNQIPVDLGIGFQQYNVHDDGSVDLPESLQSKSIRLGVRLPAPFTQRKDLFMGMDFMPLWNSAADHGFDDEAFRFNFSTSLIYRKSEKFMAACGLWFRPEYENSIIPFSEYFISRMKR